MQQMKSPEFVGRRLNKLPLPSLPIRFLEYKKNSKLHISTANKWFIFSTEQELQIKAMLPGIF